MLPQLKTALTRPVSNSFLPVFRISLGACLVWQIWWYFSSDLIRNYYIDPPFHFTWYLLDWIQPWPVHGMYVHFFVLAVAAFCMMVGFWYRAAAVVFWLGYTYVFLIDKCWYLNHYYLIALLGFIAIFLPAERRLSVDAWRKPEICSDVAPAWTLWLLRAQVGIPYFFGGVAKLNADWLRGEPMRSWLADSTDFPVIGQLFTQEWCVYIFVYGGIVIDLLAVPMLLWRRTRPWAFAILSVFHLLNARLFMIGVFPWMMIALTFITFSDPSFWERWLPKVRAAGPVRSLSRWAVATLIIYLALQLILPLRHWLYPGNVAFTREAHHFSWRMKLNIRAVRVKYFTRNPGSDELKRIGLIPYLTSTQERKILDPDSILKLAHFLSAQLGEDKPVPIYAEATVVLNGRPPSAYVDPDIDLTTKSRTLWHADWISEHPSETP